VRRCVCEALIGPASTPHAHASGSRDAGGAAAVEGAAEKAGANGAVEALLRAAAAGAAQVAALRTLSLLLCHPQVRRTLLSRKDLSRLKPRLSVS
jgi:hypothetical protein